MPDPTEWTENRCVGGSFTPCSVATDKSKCFDGEHLLHCEQAGYWAALECPSVFGSGYTCMKAPASGESGCVPPGTTTCDPATTKDMCSADGSARIVCSSGFLITDSCADDGKECSLTLGGKPVCVPPGATPCQIGVDKGECIGQGLIESCDITTLHLLVTSCSVGTTCQTSPVGWAACKPPGTPTCDPQTFQPSCLDGKTALWCEGSGFEKHVDCGAQHCMNQGSCAEAEDCSPSSYAASCQGNTALNCHPFGYVTQTTCGLVCSVQNGVAVCQ
ncbi:Hypothetical protein A7982_01873 [Minicystis rosea]|nr:Hypothetical protein A7982_01873 [Minicystis rosea]